MGLHQGRSFLFTSESVTEGHPDKICDQISDAVLDALLAQETELQAKGYISPTGEAANVKNVRCACECFTTTGLVLVSGEIRTQAYVDVERIVRGVLRDIGYTRAKFGFDSETCNVLTAIHDQSADIAAGVDKSYEVQQGEAKATDEYELIGAGDQGMMFGYAVRETPTLMPMPIYLAHRLSSRLAKVRKENIINYLRPDGKTQVTVRYENGLPVAIDKIVVSTQHDDAISSMKLIRDDITREVIAPVLDEQGIAWHDAEIYVNPTGRFVVGGPMGDTGLTGRKIIVDTYGGMGRHGGGAFSGKDCTKVDRSAAYAARWVAKNVVAAGLADQCEIQLAYAIGVAKPLSLMVDTYNTNHVPVKAIEAAINEVFDLRPGAIIDQLNLRKPQFRKTSAYGHFGREGEGFAWEETNRTQELIRAAESSH
ncbi:MAG: methionine adenosyltransferase [Coriobacteriales bacterium]|nr:methionine adenosyltransferase [Coriobacteriales bacterium]